MSEHIVNPDRSVGSLMEIHVDPFKPGHVCNIQCLGGETLSRSMWIELGQKALFITPYRAYTLYVEGAFSAVGARTVELDSDCYLPGLDNLA